MRRIILLSTVLLATPFGMESYAADCATTKPPIKAIACNVLSETIGSVPRVNVIVLINILVQDICKVHREQLVTANIKNVIVQITMFGMLHKDYVLLVRHCVSAIH